MTLAHLLPSGLMVVMELFESTAGTRGDCLLPRKYTASLDLCVYVATGDYCSVKAGCCADMTSLLFSLFK